MQFFCTLFGHFHTVTMVPDKSLFTLPVALPRTNPVGISPWFSEVVSKTKQLHSTEGKKEIPKLYHFPLGSRRCPGRRPTEKQMVGA